MYLPTIISACVGMGLLLYAAFHCFLLALDLEATGTAAMGGFALLFAHGAWWVASESSGHVSLPPATKP